MPTSRPPNEPTAHWPMTREKIKVMRARAARGLPLFHPDDARLPDHLIPVRTTKEHSWTRDLDHNLRLAVRSTYEADPSRAGYEFVAGLAVGRDRGE